MTTTREKGQVVIIVAVAMVVLLGFAALVVDIGMVYATQREERNLTDSASLAGAQELQQPGSRVVTADDRTDAREIAMTNLMDELAPGYGSLAPCGYTSDFTDCPIPGTDYVVSMRTPSTLCVTCDVDRSILVSLERRAVGTFFAGLFGQDSWDIRQTSVAGMTFAAKYAVITLRPPSPINAIQNDPNLDLNGTGTLLDIRPIGDIGTNTNLVLAGGADVELGSGYRVHHYDKPQRWTGDPTGKPINELILDPMYPYPTRTGAPTFNTASSARLSNAACTPVKATVPAEYRRDGTTGTAIRDMAIANVKCYKPGIYNFRLEAPNNEAALLLPGVYFLDDGMRVRQAIVGGWLSGQPGVTLVFPECNASCIFDGNNATLISLNAGDNFSAPGGEAIAAIGWDGVPVQTGGTPNLLMTIMVTKDDPDCVVEPFERPGCNSNQHNTINMAGGGSLYLAGVQYAPQDNVAISGGSTGTGFVGQIISWTLRLSGGTEIRQQYPGNEGNGILRLDAACAGAGATSMSNAACRP